jgi:hypothetical protein
LFLERCSSWGNVKKIFIEKVSTFNHHAHKVLKTVQLISYRELFPNNTVILPRQTGFDILFIFICNTFAITFT